MRIIINELSFDDVVGMTNDELLNLWHILNRTTLNYNRNWRLIRHDIDDQAQVNVVKIITNHCDK